MDDISNKMLAVLLLVAIIVSVSGTYVTLNSLRQVGGISFTPTGAITGKVNVSVTSTTQITFSQSLVDFGPGFVNTSNCRACEMDTYNHTNVSATGYTTGCCIGTDWPTPVADGLWIENTGNEYVNLNVTGNATAQQFIGDGATDAALFMWNFTPGSLAIKDSTISPQVIDDDTADSCLGGWKNDNSTLAGPFTTVNISRHFACGNETNFRFNFSSNKNEVEINFLVKVPLEAPKGAKAVTITATAASS